MRNSRRKFIEDVLKNTLLGTTGLASYALLSSCSSFDNYFFDDRYSLDDEVIIIGGGISGLFLAYKLRNKKTNFRLFEASNYFGGRIKSQDGMDYGASCLAYKDKIAQQLIKDLSLQTKTLDSNFVYLPEGMQALTDILVERTQGLIPYSSFRLRWKLIEVQKYKSGFDLIFQHPAGQKRFNCKKIALAIPPTQWKSVKGLLALPEMAWANQWLESLEVENTVKLVLPISSLDSPVNDRLVTASKLSSSPYLNVHHESFNIRQILKKNKSRTTLEIDIKYPSGAHVSAETLYAVVKKQMHINYTFSKLPAEQYFDWNQVDYIKGSSFKNQMAVPTYTNPHFQILGDFMGTKPKYNIESALQAAKEASELLF